MHRSLMFATAGIVAALTLTGTVAAKGPSTASLSGPGLDRALPITGEGEAGPGTPLGALVQLGGFFSGQVFEQIPDPTTSTRPTGDLGPRYRVTYRLPGPNGEGSTIVQDVYPYAKPSPVTYMAAGQRVWAGQSTHGGWFVASARVKKALVAAGLPASPPAAASGGSFAWVWLGAGLLAAAVLLAFVLRGRGVGRFRTLKTTA